jgi:hypothetical protein
VNRSKQRELFRALGVDAEFDETPQGVMRVISQTGDCEMLAASFGYGSWDDMCDAVVRTFTDGPVE